MAIMHLVDGMTLDGFLAQAGRAERLHHENLADFRNLTGFEEPKEFIPINPVQVAELRRARRRR